MITDLDYLARQATQLTESEYNALGYDQSLAHWLALAHACDNSWAQWPPYQPAIPTDAQRYLSKLDGIRDCYQHILEQLSK